MIEKINSDQENTNHVFALWASDLVNTLDDAMIRRQSMIRRVNEIKSFQFQFTKEEKEKWELTNFENIIDEIIQKVSIMTEDKNYYYIVWNLTICVDDTMWVTIWDLKNVSAYSKKNLYDLPVYQKYQSKVNGTVIDDKDLFVLLNEISKLIKWEDFQMYPNLFINNENYPQQKEERAKLLYILRWLYIITGYTWRIPFNFDHRSMDHVDTLSVKPSFVWYTRLTTEDEWELRFIMKKNV